MIVTAIIAVRLCTPVCPESHCPAAVGTFEKSGENLRLLILLLTASVLDHVLYLIEQIFINDALMCVLYSNLLFLRKPNHLFVFVGDAAFSVMDSIADIGLVG